ncbi:Hint domain-containing protein [Acidimangrovimonas sediminis]|uniref:Hint domain-containing protein n=1 Tax=Acidimangrovimonas sediminis TaxID=2056283 RepID=UPI000C7FEB43|nr:Hint domain-containing protein [Acidimangrovimonas sediminis]
MKTGTRGTFVISWAQTEVDGLMAAPPEFLAVGTTWRWAGEAVRVDGPQSLLLLSGDPDAAELRRRAARMVRRLMGAALATTPDGGGPAGEGRAGGAHGSGFGGDSGGGFPGPRTTEEAADELPERGFVLTDGRRTFEAVVIDPPGTRPATDPISAGGPGPLLTFVGEMPPAGRDLWVVRSTLSMVPPAEEVANRAGVICFTPGTRIATPGGPRAIETLTPGARILTKDDGPQEVLWCGQRRLSGARLHALPHLRPIRFRAGAMGLGRPEPDLLVSPQHRMLVTGIAARRLFNQPEVRVAAEDLVNESTVTVDTRLREVTYVHILLERHQIVWANGLETESFHPSATSLETVGDEDRARLYAVLPELARDPQLYGAFARRNLTMSEAAILRYDAA